MQTAPHGRTLRTKPPCILKITFILFNEKSYPKPDWAGIAARAVRAEPWDLPRRDGCRWFAAPAVRRESVSRRPRSQASLATAIGVEVAGLGAYGRATSATTLDLTTNAIPAPNQACLLAHELTHCLDMGFWNVTPATITRAMVGATEINAHYNQGLIAKELSIAPNLELTWAQGVAAMNAGNTTFGHMASAWDRMDVFRYLSRDGSPYKDNVDELLRTKVLYVWTRDDQWEHGGNLFHCEAHLAAKSPHDPAW